MDKKAKIAIIFHVKRTRDQLYLSNSKSLLYIIKYTVHFVIQMYSDLNIIANFSPSQNLSSD